MKANDLNKAYFEIESKFDQKKRKVFFASIYIDVFYKKICIKYIPFNSDFYLVLNRANELCLNWLNTEFNDKASFLRRISAININEYKRILKTNKL